MRKKTVDHLATTIFWYIIYFLPVVLFLIYLVQYPVDMSRPLSYEVFLTDVMGLNYVGIIPETLLSVFDGRFGINLPNTLLFTLIWYIYGVVAHLAVDFLLFIPKFALKLMHNYTEGL